MIITKPRDGLSRRGAATRPCVCVYFHAWLAGPDPRQNLNITNSAAVPAVPAEIRDSNTKKTFTDQHKHIYLMSITEIFYLDRLNDTV